MPDKKTLVSAIFFWWEKLKGTRTIKEVKSPPTFERSLDALSVDGFSITFHCHRLDYHQTYSRWFVPSKVHTLYRVYCTVTNDAPAALKEACDLTVDLPALHPEFVGDKFQKEAAIGAYMDLLITRMRERQIIHA